jgi:hypothetical protein
MGANAQTTVPTFTAAQVLTADQMNQSARTGVPVFADTTARDAGFGGTGEKTLAEGQLCYVENLTGIAQLQYYDGAAWVSFTPGGMVFLTGATFTTATSFSLPNDTFTTTYTNYKIIINVTALTADADFTMRLRAAGSDNTNGTYANTWAGVTLSATASNVGDNNGTSFNVGEQEASSTTEMRYGLTLDILSPKATATTKVQGHYCYVNKAATDQIARFGSGVFRGTTSFDSLSFISSVASSMTGNYRVYGYLES